jgi:hypothetical protein
MFDAADAADGDIRFCGLGHAQCWNGSTWEIVPTTPTTKDCTHALVPPASVASSTAQFAGGVSGSTTA